MISKVCLLYAQNDLRIEQQSVAAIGPTDVLVNVARGGICGSDLHYFNHGGFGPVRVQEPIIPGHEISGVVSECGAKVTGLQTGDKVAVNPSQPCSNCEYCLTDNHQHCVNMRFLGSARTMPHVQGGFREQLVIDQQQCFKISRNVSLGEAACAEPLAVCLHARNQAGDLAGRRILITGSGPIGVLCAAVCRDAKEVVMTDLHDFTLAIAQKMGAHHTINLVSHPDKLKNDLLQNGAFDVVFECSGVEAAIETAIDALKPRGLLVQVGVAGSINLPLNAIVGKEINLRGTHRFNTEFADAVELINSGSVDLKPLITQTYPIDDAVAAFKIAGDRSMAMKVQLRFGSS